MRTQNNLKKRLLILLLTMVFAVMNPLQLSIMEQSITVQAKPMKLSRTKATIYTGGTLQLYLKGNTTGITWSSSDETIATVSNTGLVLGKSAGKVTITAQVGKRKLKCKINVLNQYITENKLTLAVGQQEKLEFKGASGIISWDSSNESVAKVNSEGSITALKEGTTQITATCNKMTYVCEVTVVKVKFQATTTKITCSHNEQIKILVSDHKTDEVLTCTSADGTIAQGELGQWVNNEVTLTIIPKGYGTTTLTITSPYSGQKLEVIVTALNVANRVDTGTLAEYQIYEKCSPSIVKIVTNRSYGSGFFIDSNTIVTNYHIIENALSLGIETKDGKKLEVNSILGYDRSLDLAILSVESKGEPLVVNKHGIKNGETVYTIGYTSNQRYSGVSTVNNGTLVKNGNYYIESKSFGYLLNYGGPLLNAYGEVMGIYTSTENGANQWISMNEIYKISTWNPISLKDFVIRNSSDMFEDETKSISMENPQLMKLGVYLHGIMSKVQINNTDYYLVYADNTTTFTVKFAAIEGYDRVRIKISDAMNNQIPLYLYNSNIITEHTIQLAEGYYYVSVEQIAGAERNMDISYMLLIQ